MVTRERTLDRALRMVGRALATIGEEIREARLQAGLSQRVLAAEAGISPSQLSRIELGQARTVSYRTLAMLCAVLGLDLPLRAYPAGEPLRDAAQVSLLAKLRSTLPAEIMWRTEAPLRLPGDQRAWDAVIEGRGWRIPVEAETRLRDVQALLRRLALKRRDDGAAVVILLVAGTRHNRHVLRLAALDLAGDFTVRGSLALSALAAGRCPAGSSVVVL